MKLMCSVAINNRLVTNVRNKPQRTSLAISRNSVKSNELFILLQTVKNPTGTKYKISNNIEKVYTNFVDDGKATIRFIEPAHDLSIQCDAIQLKSFLRVLKLGLEKNANLFVLPISNLNPKQVIPALTKNRTKITIKKPADYPVLEGFPRTCEELCLSDLQRRTFDRQILKLQSLKVLDLSNNNLTVLPKELGNLAYLQQLILNGNKLGKAPITKWSWLECSNLKRTLKVLNLSNNQIKVLPHQLGKLEALVNLDVSSNSLQVLPHSLGHLPHLSFLNVSNNELQSLPGSMKHSRLESLDISDNKFQGMQDYNERNNFQVPSLVEIAARTVIQSRKDYNASMIPLTLVSYLDHARYCVCGRPCFECCVHLLVLLDMSTIAHSVRSSANQTIPFDCYFCSHTCLQRYAPRAALR